MPGSAKISKPTLYRNIELAQVWHQDLEPEATFDLLMRCLLAKNPVMRTSFKALVPTDSFKGHVHFWPAAAKPNFIQACVDM